MASQVGSRIRSHGQAAYELGNEDDRDEPPEAQEGSPESPVNLIRQDADGQEGQRQAGHRQLPDDDVSLDVGGVSHP
jgi:hypothetical protein